MSENAPQLCYITTCKGRLAHLKQTLPRVVGQPGVSCVVVDYSCPDGTGDWVERNHPEVKVVRVAGENTFSASRARNFGAAAAEAPWLGFFDADILWAPELAGTVLPQLQSGYFYRARPVTPQTWGSIICQRADFEATGGYDEAFVGWGGEDDDFILRLGMLGRTEAGFPGVLIEEIPHDNAARVRFHEVKDRTLQHRINMLYIQAKLDLVCLMGGPVDFPTRKVLFDEISKTILHAAKAGLVAATVDVNLPAKLIKPPPINGLIEHWRLGRRMVYSIDIAARYVEKA